MATHFTDCLFVAATLFIDSLYVVAFTVNLYQRDSFGSPFYDPSLPKTEIIRRAIARNVNKSNTVTVMNGPTSTLFDHGVSYFMKIRLGTPPVDIIASIHTGSDLTWIQCQPSTRHIPQRVPLFDPQASSSYSRIPCNRSKLCPPLSHSVCETDEFCHHYIHYGDNSYSKGLLSTETLRMDSTHPVIEVPNYIFGCGTDNYGYSTGEGSGVIGLGAGPQSLVSQLEPLSRGRFAYCFIRLGQEGKVSHIRFGRDAFVHIHKPIILPLVKKHPRSAYFTTIEAFTIGGSRVEFEGVEGNNIIIHSETTLLEVPRKIYAQIRHIVTMQISATPVPDPKLLLDLCYPTSKSLLMELPKIVANFQGGDVPLEWYNAFAQCGSVICLAFRPTDEYTIYGTLAQQNFIVGYDKNAGTVSFKPFDCSKF